MTLVAEGVNIKFGYVAHSEYELMSDSALVEQIL